MLELNTPRHEAYLVRTDVNLITTHALTAAENLVALAEAVRLVALVDVDDHAREVLGQRLFVELPPEDAQLGQSGVPLRQRLLEDFDQDENVVQRDDVIYADHTNCLFLG